MDVNQFHIREYVNADSQALTVTFYQCIIPGGYQSQLPLASLNIQMELTLTALYL